MTPERQMLEQAREALESCAPGDYSTGHVMHPSFDDRLVNTVLATIDAHLSKPVETSRAEQIQAVKARLVGMAEVARSYVDVHQVIPISEVIAELDKLAASLSTEQIPTDGRCKDREGMR